MSPKKLVIIVLRGGMDGLAAASPRGDADFARYRHKTDTTADLPLTPDFALHPNLKTLKSLFDQGDMSFIHAIGLPRSTRSHFRAQDILESGTDQSFKTGWLARSLAWHNAQPRNQPISAIAYGTQRPLILAGSDAAFNWSDPDIAPDDEALLADLARTFYVNHPRLETAVDGLAMLMGGQGNQATKAGKQRGRNIKKATSKRKRQRSEYDVIGKIIAAKSEPNIGIISVENWDTHQSQARSIDASFSKLDKGIAKLRTQLDDVWDDTIILITTEFGRTVRFNGSKGTDHGTGSVLFALGGAVNGAKRFGDWPGLSEASLFEGRDLAISNSVFDVFAHILHAHLNIPVDVICSDIFPNISQDFTSMELVTARRGADGYYA